MKKQKIRHKLAALGVKTTGREKMGDLRKSLAAAQADATKPGGRIGETDISSSSGKGAKPPRGRK